LMRIYGFVATNDRPKDCFGKAVRSLPVTITPNAVTQNAPEAVRYTVGSAAFVAA
jgi:hypothetical protein